MRQYRGVMGWLSLLLLTACVVSPTEERTAGRASALTSGSERPAVDRLLTQGDIQVAQRHLRAFGFDPGPSDGIYTAQTQAAVRAFQATYGLVVSGRLDRQTREMLKVGSDPKPGD
jgi:peptidoglycan hydrolase-like protein with peptidoglycan-binding domain